MKNLGKEEFEKNLLNGIKLFESILFNNFVLEEFNLSDIKFSNCKFKNIDIKESKLTNINFMNCKLTSCDFQGSNLNLVIFDETNIEKTSFSNCCIDNMTHQYSLNGIVFKECELKGINIKSGIEIIDCKFEKCNFNNSIIKCPEICDSTFNESSMKNIVVNSGVSGCNFINCNFEKSKIDEIQSYNDFHACNFKDAVLLGREYMTQKEFKDSNLEGCQLWGLVAKEKIDLEGFILSRVNIRNCNWENANLKKCVFKDANMIKVNLKGSNLVQADFTGANLTGADLRNANLEGICFNNAILNGVKILEKDYKYISKHINRDDVIIEE